LLVLLLLAAVAGADGFLGGRGGKRRRDGGAAVDGKALAPGWRGGEGKAGALAADLGLVQMAGHFLFEYLKDYKVCMCWWACCSVAGRGLCTRTCANLRDCDWVPR